MLDWLNNLSQKTDHPMHCVEEAERLLTGLADEPLKALEEIASWLTTIAQSAGFQLATRLAVMLNLRPETTPPSMFVTIASISNGSPSRTYCRVLWMPT